MGNPPIITPIVVPVGPAPAPSPGPVPTPGPGGGGGGTPPSSGGGAGTPITLTLNNTITNQAASVAVTVQPAPAVGSVLTFSLQVIDDIGGVSPAATCTVTVRDVPHATLNGPAAVTVNTPVNLAGAGQPSGGGKITGFMWTLTKVVAGG